MLGILFLALLAGGVVLIARKQPKKKKQVKKRSYTSRTLRTLKGKSPSAKKSTMSKKISTPTGTEASVKQKKSKKKTKRKWNRVHKFGRKKSTPRQVGHPVYIYGARGDLRKYLTFTHTPEEGNEENYERLNHNIDKDDPEACYVKKRFSISNKETIQEPDKEYRIHEEDIETVKKYKK